MTRKSLSAAALLIALGTALSGCAGGAAPSTQAGGDRQIAVGFFGFAAANSFAQGVFGGVKDGVAANNATATFVDGNFDGPTQVQQITDAVTSRRFDVIVIQANDNLAVQQPLKAAVDAGITVVVEFTPVGPDLDTVAPQVPGAISIVDPPVGNGEALGELGISACADTGKPSCKVAYMEGFRSLPLDNARTKAVVDTLRTKPGVEVVAQVEGGYTQDKGRSAFQDIIQANPDVDVVIGSSQAIAGASAAAGATSPIRFVANGGSKTAVEAVTSKKWFAAYVTDIHKNGATAAELGVKHARGEQVATATDEADLAPNRGRGTAASLADFTSRYDD